MIKKFIVAVFALIFTAGVVSCREEESGVEKIEDGVEDVADDIEDSVD